MEWLVSLHFVSEDMFCDLYTLNISDGTFFTQIVLKLKVGLVLLHSATTTRLPDFDNLFRQVKSTATTVSGIEFSTEYNSKQLHIVGLFIKKENYSDITEIMAGRKN